MRLARPLLALALVAGPLAAALAQEPAVSPAPAAPSRPAGQIRGSISYGRHAPAVGVVVLVRPLSGPARVYAATTGEAGTFAFDGVPDGTYRAEARRDGYVPVIKDGIVVRAPFRAVVELMMTPGTSPSSPAPAASGAAGARGQVRVAGGAPLAEARVRLIRADGQADPVTASTDAAGAFAFEGLAAGRFRFDVTGAGLLPLRFDVDLDGETTFDLALARQPANYQPLAQDLIVPEDVIPPKAP